MQELGTTKTKVGAAKKTQYPARCEPLSRSDLCATQKSVLIVTILAQKTHLFN